MANRVHVWHFLLNESGEPIEDANVYIYQSGSTTPVYYYQNRDTGLPYRSFDGTASDLTLIQTDSEGYFSFYISYDSSDDQSYDPTTKFKIVWIKAGIANGVIDDMDIIPFGVPVDETDTDTEKNKLVSNAQAARWEATSNLTSPEISANSDALWDIWNHVSSAGDLNATDIGTTTPASGTFTNLYVLTDPSSGTGVGNRDYSDARYALDSTYSLHITAASAHSVSEIVGTSESQTLTNKTINSSTIGAGTPSTGAFTTLAASTDPVDANGVGDRGYNDARYTLDSTYSEHVTASTSIHGVGAGSIMGTTLTQAVTNKSITNSNIGYTASGTLTNPGSGGFSYLSSIDGAIDGTIIGGSTPAAGSFSTVDINAGTIDGTTIGGSTPAAGSFSTVDINAGTIDGTSIGSSSPAAGSFSTVNINGGNINDTDIGQTTPASGSFTNMVATTATITTATVTTLNATNISATTFSFDEINNTDIGLTGPARGNFSFANIENVDIDNGLIDSTIIGRSFPASGSFTTLLADTATIGNITNSTFTNYTLSGGTLENVMIGTTTPTSASFTDTKAFTASAGVLRSSQIIVDDLQAAYLDDCIIGGTTPASGSFSVLYASGGVLDDVVLNNPSFIMTSGDMSGVSISANSIYCSGGANLPDAIGSSADWTMTGGAIDGVDIGTNNPQTGNFLFLNAESADIDNLTADMASLTVTGALTIEGTMTVSGDATITGTLTVGASSSVLDTDSIKINNYWYTSGKNVSITSGYSNVININIDDNNACYVDVFITGNWANHGPVSYKAGFHVQNNAGGGSPEPGILSYEYESGSTNDYISGQVISISGDDFAIQIRTNDDGDGFAGGTDDFTGVMTYQVMGPYNTIT